MEMESYLIFLGSILFILSLVMFCVMAINIDMWNKSIYMLMPFIFVLIASVFIIFGLLGLYAKEEEQKVYKVTTGDNQIRYSNKCETIKLKN